MSTRRAKERGGEDTTTEAPQGFPKMCRRMMSGKMSDCCGPEMREMMSRWIAEFRAGEEADTQRPRTEE